MQLRDYIEQGATKAGSLTALGKILDETQPHMSSARGHKRPLTLEACVILADYLNVDRFQVIAANKLATETKEEKRAFWTPFVEHARAAGIALALTLVTNFVTPSPAEAAPRLDSAPKDFVLCKVLELLAKLKQSKLLRAIQMFIERLEESFVTAFAPRIAQP